MYDSIITADLHIGLNLDSWLQENGLEFKTNEIFRMIDYIIDYAIDNNIDHIVIAGDVFDMKNPTSLLRALLLDRLNILERNKITTDIIEGNHDSSNSGRSSVYPIKKYKWKYINVYEDVMAAERHGNNYIFVPHITKSKLNATAKSDIEKLTEKYMVKKINKLLTKKKNNIIIGHLHFKGGRSGSEEKILKGGINFFPDLDKSLIKAVFLGHLHERQIIKWGKTTVAYPGSLVRCDFGERKQEKGFIVYDNKKNDFEFEDVDSVEYKQVKINLVDKNYVDLNEDKIKRSVNGKIVKLEINTTEENKRSVNIGEIEAAFSKYCYIAKKEFNIVDRVRREVDDFATTPEKIFKKYAKENVKADKELKALVANLGLDIIKTVRENNEA